MSSVSASTEDEGGEHPLLGSVLRHTYRILRVLDRGGLGIVFEAEHVRLRRLVAVKVLAQHVLVDAQALARFKREAEIISQLQHPNVVQLIDFDSTELGEPYLVMEYLAGQSLESLLERYGRLDAQRSARIVHQAACGLNAAHRASVVHRDLKPGNIFLVDVPGEGVLVKLLDFGIARHTDLTRRHTGEYDVPATPEYTAPEQALGRGPHVDHRADQYSLAVIAFEAISGRSPFIGRSAAELLERVIASDTVPLERFVPEAPSAVGRVLRRAMARDPDERFSSVLEFAGALLAAAGCSVPPPSDPHADVRALFLEDPPTPLPPASLVTPRPDGRYYATHPAAPDNARTEPPGPYPETDPPGPFAPTEPPSFSDLPSERSLRASIPHRLPDVDRVLDQAREAFGLGDVDLAVSYAESALHMGATLEGRSKQRVEASSSLIESIFLGRIGSLRTLLVARSVPPGHEEIRLLPEQAFLLSRLDSPSSVEEVLDLSPLPRRETLRHLVALLRQGVIRTT